MLGQNAIDGGGEGLLMNGGLPPIWVTRPDLFQETLFVEVIEGREFGKNFTSNKNRCLPDAQRDLMALRWSSTRKLSHETLGSNENDGFLYHHFRRV